MIKADAKSYVEDGIDVDSWEIVIRPENSFFRLNLKEVWHYRDLLMLFVRRDVVAFYKQTILGPIWYFVQPLFTMAVYMFVFGSLAELSTDGLPQQLFYLTGITAWSYFADCLTKTATVFKDNASIFGKVYFPRIIVPLSLILSNLVRFGVQLILLVTFIIYYIAQGAAVSIGWQLILFPFLVLLMALQGLGIGMIVSALTTKYRDLALLLNFGIQLIMYLTTVVYPLSSLEGKFRVLVSLNPLTPLIEGMRFALLGQGTFGLYSGLYALVSTLIILGFGTLVFNKVERNFIDTI